MGDLEISHASRCERLVVSPINPSIDDQPGLTLKVQCGVEIAEISLDWESVGLVKQYLVERLGELSGLDLRTVEDKAEDDFIVAWAMDSDPFGGVWSYYVVLGLADNFGLAQYKRALEAFLRSECYGSKATPAYVDGWVRAWLLMDNELRTLPDTSSIV